MSLTAIAFLLIFVIFTALSWAKGPFWGLLLYIHVYFNMPSHQFWHAEVPDLRWSFLSLIIILTSCIIHKNKLASRPVLQSPITKQLVLFYVLVLLTAWFSSFPEIVTEKTHKFLGYMLIYFIILKIIRSFDQLVIVLGWIILESFQLARLAHGRYHGGRLEGIGLPDASSANLFGGFIAMGLPFFLPFLFSKNKKIKLSAIILAPLVVNAFVMCGSRGAFLGIFASTLIVIYFVYTQRGKTINKKAIFVYLLIAATGFWLLLSPDYKARLYTLTDESSENVSSGRTAIWSHGIHMVSDYPFGAGPGGFMALSPLYIPQEYIQKGVGQRAAHNTYLLILVEQGYVGLLLYLSLIASVFLGFFKTWKLIKPGGLQLLNNTNYHIKVEYVHLALLASFSSFIVTIIFASRLYYEFFYICLSLIVVYFHLVHDAFMKRKGMI